MPETVSIVTDNLTKVYNLGRARSRKTAVSGLSVEVPQGVIFGFLGPNGAGKTTTIKMLLDFVRPTSGGAKIFGLPVTETETRKLIGYLPEQPYFHKFLRPREVVSMHAALAGVERGEIGACAQGCLERAGIAEYADVPISKLSKGLTQRVGIAQALVGDPRLLILDEPTSGLDPICRRQTRDLLLELRSEGRTVFLSSHLLSEIENVCDVVAILKQGRLVACGPPESIRSGSSQIVVTAERLDAETAGALKFIGASVQQLRDTVAIATEPRSIYEVMQVLGGRRIEIVGIETARESLEEAFLRLAA